MYGKCILLNGLFPVGPRGTGLMESAEESSDTSLTFEGAFDGRVQRTLCPDSPAFLAITSCQLRTARCLSNTHTNMPSN